MTPVEKAEQAAREAAVDSHTLEVIAAVLAAQQATQQPAVPVQAPRPAIHITPGTLIAGTAAIAVIGVVFTSLIIAISVAACSTAVCALVVRSILTGQRRR